MMTYQNYFEFATAHAIKVEHDTHRVGDAPPPAALAACAEGQWPQGVMSTTCSSLPSLSCSVTFPAAPQAVSRSRPTTYSHLSTIAYKDIEPKQVRPTP
eukprot:6199811-Pleurochrysis_carterae.AAC.1